LKEKHNRQLSLQLHIGRIDISNKVINALYWVIVENSLVENKEKKND
jgi:hypothetical protein